MSQPGKGYDQQQLKNDNADIQAACAPSRPMRPHSGSGDENTWNQDNWTGNSNNINHWNQGDLGGNEKNTWNQSGWHNNHNNQNTWNQGR